MTATDSISRCRIKTLSNNSRFRTFTNTRTSESGQQLSTSDIDTSTAHITMPCPADYVMIDIDVGGLFKISPADMERLRPPDENRRLRPNRSDLYVRTLWHCEDMAEHLFKTGLTFTAFKSEAA